jgi:hypothetical protein
MLAQLLFSSIRISGLCTLIWFLLFPQPMPAQTNVLVPAGAFWKFIDDIPDLAEGWQSPDLDDSAWKEGNAPLGYGEPTVIVTPTASGSQVNYFRHAFDLLAFPSVSDVTFRLWRDDIAKVYINGNLAYGDSDQINEWTPPVVDVLPTSFLRSGNNVVAVEVRQAYVGSSDLVFDFELFYTNAGPPGVTITRPADNAVVRIGTDLQIEAIVTALSNVTAVQFFGDGTLLGQDSDEPYSWVWTNVPSGAHVLTATASSIDGAATSAPVRVTAVANLPPQVAITSPAQNAIVSAGDIVIRASASDPDGSIPNVAFFEGDTWLGDSSIAPYMITWPNVAPGEYFLTAQALDNEGLVSTSAVVRIEVQVPPPATLLRGPYLQLGTPTSVVVKWRTDSQVSSRVRYGTSANNLNLAVDEPNLVVNHEVKLEGLQPDTRYFYGIGSTTEPLASEPGYFFVTAPASPKPTRVWVIGDSGTASPDARAVADAYVNFTGNRGTDLWLMLGDNAYGGGTDQEYQRAVFDFYPDLLRKIVLWPTIGNHDASFDYFDIFSLPQAGEAGGIASGTERYYSFNYGNIHFVCLDSSYSPRGSNDPMCLWLKADLEANTNEWLIAFWHHPPYSKGSHNSDAEFELIGMRENAVPILEQHGVDLVLCGHSHCYERSYLLRGNYGDSSTLDSSMILNGGSGRADQDGAYRKQISGLGAHHGTVYTVAGSSGWATFGSLDHPAMYVSYLVMGSLILDIDGPALDAKFLNLNGTIDDYFTIIKDGDQFRITAIQLMNGDVLLRWTSTPGERYQVEHTHDFSSAFVAVSGPVPATGTSTTWTHRPAPGQALGFYRARELPE